MVPSPGMGAGGTTSLHQRENKALEMSRKECSGGAVSRALALGPEVHLAFAKISMAHFWLTCLCQG